jgi:hypothetical protein
MHSAGARGLYRIGFSAVCDSLVAFPLRQSQPLSSNTTSPAVPGLSGTILGAHHEQMCLLSPSHMVSPPEIFRVA